MVGISEDDKPFIYHMWLAGNLVYLSLPCPHLVPKHRSLGSNIKWCSVHTLCVSDMYLFVVVTWIQVTPGYWHKMVLCPHTGHLILHVFRHQFLSEVVVSYGCAMRGIASKLTRNASSQGFVCASMEAFVLVPNYCEGTWRRRVFILVPCGYPNRASKPGTKWSHGLKSPKFRIMNYCWFSFQSHGIFKRESHGS